MQIVYKSIKNGYARIDKDGKLLITIPLSKKGNKAFEDIMIAKGQQLFKRYSKHTHIDPVKKDTILLFGEEIPLEDFYKHYPNFKLKAPLSRGDLSSAKSEGNKKGGLKQPAPCSLLPATNKILKKILEEYTAPIFDMYSKKLGISIKKLSFRKTSSKRGSCTHDQKISLNLDLIHLPTKYIKYVIIHECCHLKVKNHSKRFRALVESFCPEYKQIKKELRKFVIRGQH